ncbi:hypothetical protein Ga0100230_015115 [Opitutaceae bacterium TAV3]|nr:hypothetical protein Ga0100230_015115 [Opitutaceae bacterium TAV3]
MAGVTGCKKIELAEVKLVGGGVLEKVGDVGGGAAVGTGVNGFCEAGGAGEAFGFGTGSEGAKVFEGEFDFDVKAVGEGENGVETAGGFFGEVSGAVGFDVEEGVAEPEADVVAAVGGKCVEPAFVAGESGFGGRVETRETEIETDGDEGVSGCGVFEVTGVARANANRACVARGGGGMEPPVMCRQAAIGGVVRIIGRRRKPGLFGRNDVLRLGLRFVINGGAEFELCGIESVNDEGGAGEL